MIAPKTITIKSDNNVLTYKDILETKDGIKYEYQYTKSISKKGEKLYLTEEQLDKLIKTNS